MVADWRLPAGVSRGLWDYVHDASLAAGYDAALAETPLLTHDRAFVAEYFPSSGRVVDLGCGTGRLSLELARAGYRVAAVDLSEGMLSIVGAKAMTAGVAIDRIKANLVELGGFADESFDAAACLFQTLGMIVGRDNRRKALRHVWRTLRPGGVFVLHVHNRWFNAGTRHGRRLILGDLWNSVLGRQEPGDYIMPPHQGLGPMPMHLFTRREIVRELKSIGFVIREIRTIAIDGPLKNTWFFPGLRAYGYMIAAIRERRGSSPI